MISEYEYEYDGGDWEVLRDWDLTELTVKQASIPGFPISSIALGLLTPFLLRRLRPRYGTLLLETRIYLC